MDENPRVKQVMLTKRIMPTKVAVPVVKRLLKGLEVEAAGGPNGLEDWMSGPIGVAAYYQLASGLVVMVINSEQVAGVTYLYFPSALQRFMDEAIVEEIYKQNKAEGKQNSDKNRPSKIGRMATRKEG